MTTTSLLPSSGPPPPGLDRPVIPARFRHAVARNAETPAPEPQKAPQKTPEPPAQTVPQQGQAGSSGRNLGGASAVVVQVRESAARPQNTAVQPSQARASTATPLTEDALSDEDKAEVSRLRARDQEVRTHEAAHQSAGQGYTSPPGYDYVRGPDDHRYAVGGHVKIDTKEVRDDPQATIAKMEVVRRAALAPAQPSGQDRAVASAAAAKIREAEAQIAAQRADAAKAAAEGQNGQGAQASLTTLTAQTAPAAETDQSGQSAAQPTRQPINLIA